MSNQLTIGDDDTQLEGIWKSGQDLENVWDSRSPLDKKVDEVGRASMDTNPKKAVASIFNAFTTSELNERLWIEEAKKRTQNSREVNNFLNSLLQAPLKKKEDVETCLKEIEEVGVNVDKLREQLQRFTPDEKELKRMFVELANHKLEENRLEEDKSRAQMEFVKSRMEMLEKAFAQYLRALHELKQKIIQQFGS